MKLNKFEALMHRFFNDYLQSPIEEIVMHANQFYIYEF